MDPQGRPNSIIGPRAKHLHWGPYLHIHSQECPHDVLRRNCEPTGRYPRTNAKRYLFFHFSIFLQAEWGN